MGFVRIVFIWLIFSIIYFGWKWLKERKRIKKFKSRIRNYEPMNMSISERLKYKGGHRK